MNPHQREKVAKYLYDLSKMVYATAVVGNFIAWKNFDVVALFSGTAAAYLFFWSAYVMDSGGD